MEASNFSVSQAAVTLSMAGWSIASGVRAKRTRRIALTSMMSAVSGGFAIVQPGSQLSINAVEGFPLEDFSSDVNIFKYLIGFVLR